MIKGQHGGAHVVRKLVASFSQVPLLIPCPIFTCPHSTTFLAPSFPPTRHISSIHTSRYIDFQITKLKKYTEDGTPISASGIASLLSKPYITIHQAKELLQLAKTVKCINTPLYNDYVGALSTNGDVKAVVDAIQDMENLGIEPNIRTFNSLLHLVISNSSLFPNVLAQIHQKGLEYDVATYNIVMRHYALVGKPEKCIEMEALMEKNGISPNVYTFNQMLHIWAKRGMAKKCDEILERMRAHNIHPTLMSYTILIQLHVNKLNDVDTGLRLFSEMKAQGIVPDSRPYDILIEALSARGEFQRSLELFHEMQQGGCAEGTMTYSVLIDKFTKEGKFEEGWQIFNQMKDGKEPLRAELWNVFLRYFAQRGDLTQSLVILQDMKAAHVQPTTQTYNVLLSTEGMTLESKLKVWESMKENGVERDRFTFNMMIVAYMKEGRYTDCEAIFNEMALVKVQPDPHLYITMRDMYKRAGQLEKSQAMSAAAKKLVRHNFDLRDDVRKKQQKHQLQKRIDFQKDIQEVEMLLATQNKNQETTTATTDFPQQQAGLQQQTSPSVLQPILQPQEPQLSEPAEPPEPSELPEPHDNYYPQTPNPYFSQQSHAYFSEQQYKPLYYVPYQTQYTPPSSPPEQQGGLPRRRRAINQTPPPPSYSPYSPPQGYWASPNMQWPPPSSLPYTHFDPNSDTPDLLPSNPPLSPTMPSSEPPFSTQTPTPTGTRNSPWNNHPTHYSNYSTTHNTPAQNFPTNYATHEFPANNPPTNNPPTNNPPTNNFPTNDSPTNDSPTNSQPNNSPPSKNTTSTNTTPKPKQNSEKIFKSKNQQYRN